MHNAASMLTATPRYKTADQHERGDNTALPGNPRAKRRANYSREADNKKGKVTTTAGDEREGASPWEAEDVPVDKLPPGLLLTDVVLQVKQNKQSTQRA